jgi:predicted HD phosphohydrolase
MLLILNLGDFYHTFMELKSRKMNRTKFLRQPCEALIRKWTKRKVRLTIRHEANEHLLSV